MAFANRDYFTSAFAMQWLLFRFLSLAGTMHIMLSRSGESGLLIQRAKVSLSLLRMMLSYGVFTDALYQVEKKLPPIPIFRGFHYERVLDFVSASSVSMEIIMGFC
jgi:hypothetical protein